MVTCITWILLDQCPANIRSTVSSIFHGFPVQTLPTTGGAAGNGGAMTFGDTLGSARQEPRNFIQIHEDIQIRFSTAVTPGVIPFVFVSGRDRRPGPWCSWDLGVAAISCLQQPPAWLAHGSRCLRLGEVDIGMSSVRTSG